MLKKSRDNITRKIKHKLIKLVEKEEALWNPLDPGYQLGVTVKTEIWDKLSTVLGCDRSHVKKMWRVLRTQFGREFRKRQNSQSGNEARKYVSRWPFFEDLKFLEPTIWTRSTWSIQSDEDQSFDPNQGTPTLKDIDHATNEDPNESTGDDTPTPLPVVLLMLNSAIYEDSNENSGNNPPTRPTLSSLNDLLWTIEVPNENSAIDQRTTNNAINEDSNENSGNNPPTRPTLSSLNDHLWTDEVPNENSDPRTTANNAINEDSNENSGNGCSLLWKNKDPDVLFAMSLIPDIQRAKFKPGLKAEICRIISNYLQEEEVCYSPFNETRHSSG